MRLLSKILVFLRLKYEETIGCIIKEYPISSIVCTFTFLISTSIHIICGVFPLIISILIGLLYTCLMGIIIGMFNCAYPYFKSWIVSNWEEAEVLMRKRDNEEV